MRAKLGLVREEPEDAALIEALLDAMHRGEADFTLTFRRLAEAVFGETGAEPLRALFGDVQALDAWLPAWRTRLTREARDPAAIAKAMRAVNPAFIPRNHRVEEVIDAAVNRNDFTAFHKLVEITAKPFDDQPLYARYMDPPLPHERVRQTFCGT